MNRIDELRAVFGDVAHRRLFERIRARVEQAGIENVRRIHIADPSQTERAALDGLLGKTIPAGRISFALADLDRSLRESRLATNVEEVLVLLGGPLTNRRRSREAKALARDFIFERAQRHPVLARPELAGWLDDVRREGLIARAARRHGGDESVALDQALHVLARLPRDGELLPKFASTTTGDAHALDAGRVLAMMVLRGAQRLAAWPTPPQSAEERRRLWAEVGVECDALSADFVALRVPIAGDSAFATRVRAANGTGDPIRVTLWDIDRYGWGFDGGVRMPELFIVENPALVAASASRFGPHGPALICVEGVPTTAAWRFLRLCREARIKLRFHCDFDWGGVRIGNLLVERVAAEPWRMSAVDYEAAVARLDEAIDLPDRIETALWDGALAEAMARARRVVYEEQLLDELLDAMGADTQPS